jgi:hypothetical protein
MDLNVKL